MAVTIGFRPLERGDFTMLVGWFAEPEIARWWNEPAELTAVEAKYGPRVDGREPTSMWIADLDGRPAGLFQCYRHRDHPEHDASVGIPDAVGIDYLMGATHRGRGLAGSALRAFAGHSLDQHPDTVVCVATPAQENTASWRALERAGFTRRGPCRPPDEPPAFVYALDRSVLTSSS